MYPLLLNAPIKDYIWGGTRLIDEFQFETAGEKAAEAWVLSCHKDGDSMVCNGRFEGEPLSTVLEMWGQDALGKNAEKFAYFPLLIKLIDARDRLSVQVHPNDDYALENEGEYGKTEMWYVVDADADATLIYGFQHEITKAEFEQRIKDNSLEEVCNFVPVKKGDVFFISAGTLHAIGKGILIAEVQQNSNTTYRVSDYGRLGADGKPRPLHVEKALAVTKTTPPAEKYGDVGEKTVCPFGTVRKLADCEMFVTHLLSLDGTAKLREKDSFMSLVVLNGEAVLSYADEKIHLKKGSSVFIPANIQVSVLGKAEILCSKV